MTQVAQLQGHTYRVLYLAGSPDVSPVLSLTRVVQVSTLRTQDTGGSSPNVGSLLQGQTIVTGAGDETLRFWAAFPPGKSEKRGQTSALSPFSGIR